MCLFDHSDCKCAEVAALIATSGPKSDVVIFLSSINIASMSCKRLEILAILQHFQ